MNNFKQKRGISLIVLIITIVIIIILAGQVILSLSKNNPMNAATEAVFKNNLSNYGSELDMWIIKEYGEKMGDLDVSTINATKTSGTYNGLKIKDIIPNISAEDEDMYQIVNGKLLYIGTGIEEQNWASETLSSVMPIDASAGEFHTLVLMSDGTVRAFGANWFGQLGDGNDLDILGPVTVQGLTNVKQVSAGRNHSVVLLNDGTVKTWGDNTYGQLGIGNSEYKISPQVVPGLTGVKEISAGRNYTVALLNDGTVKSWGDNTDGELGDGTIITKWKPVAVSTETPDLTSIAGDNEFEGYWTEFFAGNTFTVRFNSDHTVPGAGFIISKIKYIQSGIEYEETLPTPIVHVNYGADETVNFPISKPGATSISINFSLFDTEEYSDTVQILDSSNNILKEYDGQLAVDSMYAILSRCNPLTGVDKIDAGSFHMLALMNNDTVKSWGHNNEGQLGNGTTNDSWLPVDVSGLTNVKQLSAGESHSLALLNNGEVRAWGHNWSGELADGTQNRKLLPINFGGLTNVKQVIAGGYHSIVLLNDGTVKACGDNDGGQLGDGTLSERWSLVNIDITDVRTIAAGYEHTVVILNDGGVKTCGDNTEGELGDGTKIERLLLTPISGITN